ncbi:MAG: hypothetical protein HUU54_06755 [Ignavibacteriaceae bacterium]|nr:hypothetical protein [Ignavibacteriaceae bacterium]
MLNLVERNLKSRFRNQDLFSRNELLALFREIEPELNENTMNWRIHHLRKKNVISQIKSGYYSFSHKKKYTPSITEDIPEFTKIIDADFPDYRYCIWSTVWLNEFSLHQSIKKLLIIEIEKEAEESLFYSLVEKYWRRVFFRPDQKVIDRYVTECENPVIIKRLLTRSPLEKLNFDKSEVIMPRLEKMLVDIFAEDKLYYLYQGTEMVNIFYNAINTYAVDFTKLLGYAARRGKGNEIKQFLAENNFSIKVELK